MKFLIVDDEPDIGEELSEIFEFHGIKTIVETSAEKAYLRLKGDNAIRFVITDLKMPGMTGVDLIGRISSEAHGAVKFVVMSGHGGDEDTEELIKKKFVDVVDFVRKPVSLERLREVIDLAKKILGSGPIDFEGQHDELLPESRKVT